jgi:phage-related minor tail protein
MIGVRALAAGTAALMYSYYQGSSTLSEFNKTLTLTGNTAGLTAVRMQTIAAAGEKAGLTFNQTSQALTARYCRRSRGCKLRRACDLGCEIYGCIRSAGR